MSTPEPVGIEPPSGTARLFVAVWPDAAAIELLQAMTRPTGTGVRWTPPEQWHVTLDFLGRADPGAVAARLGQLQHARVTATMSAAARLLARSAVVFPVAGLDGFALAVRRVLAGVGPQDAPGEPGERGFVGHLTVGRLRRSTGTIVPVLPVLAQAVSWQVDALSLVRSDLSDSGARYTVLARVALA